MKTPILLPLAAISLWIVPALSEEIHWKRHTIDAADPATGKVGADGVRLADINGDGLQDVVTGWENGDAIRVCLNPGAEQSKQVWPGVTVGRVAGAEDAVFADLDGDGFQDVVTSTEGKTRTVFVHWSPSKKGALLQADQWTTASFPSTKGKEMWMYALPFDVNEDGNLDIVLGSKSSGASVSWLRNPGKAEARDLSKWKLVRLAEAGWIMSLVKIDLDGDGRDDLVYSDRKGGNSGVFVMKKIPRAPWFEQTQQLGASGEEVMFLDVVDLDGDEKLDIAAAVRPDKVLYLYQPESPEGNWQQDSQALGVPSDRFGGSKAIRVADMSLDGKSEIVITCEQAKGELSGIMMVNYHPGPLLGNLHHTDISGPEGVKYDRMEMIDLDGDGDLDVMTCEERASLGVFWYENPAK